MAAVADKNKSSHRNGDPRDSESPFGALTFISWAHDWNNFFYREDEKVERAAALMKEAGIGFSRADFLWSDLEPQKGHFDFAKQDRVIEILAKNGIKTLGTLNYNPLWRNVPWNSAPDVDAFVGYAREAVRHFKGQVKYWEIWNEPDHDIYWSPQDGMNAYSQLLKTVYPAIKAEDPTAVVLTGGLSDGSKHLRSIYEKAGADCFDIVNLHPFVNPLLPDALASVRDIYSSAQHVMAEFGDSEKPIWFTEIGCPGAEPAQASGGWWAGAVPNEAQQAAWVETIFENALSWKGVEKIFWAFFRDTDNHFKNDVDRFGLLRLDFSPKPAYQACKKVTSNRPKKT